MSGVWALTELCYRKHRREERLAGEPVKQEVYIEIRYLIDYLNHDDDNPLVVDWLS